MNRRLMVLGLVLGQLCLVPAGAIATAPQPSSEPAAGGMQRGNTCIISVTGISFPNYNPSSRSPNDSQGFMTVRCRGGQVRNFVVHIGPGTSGRISDRTMRGPGGSVRYNLFLDALRQSIWGDGSHGSKVLARNDARNRTITVPIYARVPAGQAVAAGTYQDTLAVMVIF